MFHKESFETYYLYKRKTLLGSGDLYFVNNTSLIHTDNLFKEKK